jgi:hypothetical protein
LLSLDRSSTQPRLLVGDHAKAAVVQVAALVAPAGQVTVLPVDRAGEEGGGLALHSVAGPMRARSRWRVEGDVVAVELELVYDGEEDLEAGVRFGLDLPGRATEPHWMVPGCFYRHNRFAECLRRYPRALSAGEDAGPLESSWWSFRSDRAAVPAVFGWTEAACVGLATEPLTDLGLSGVGFGLDGHVARLWLDWPYREEPVVYDGSPVPAPSDVRWHRWHPGERRSVGFRIAVTGPRPHAYDPFVRHLYDRHRRDHRLAPWMTPTQAAALTGYGLHRWHWRSEHDALYETAAFDRANPELDRAHMHVGWVSGTPWAHALLAYGRKTGNAPYVEAASRVLDKIAGARTPAGTFWGMWTLERGWRGGWNPDASWLHARTLAEATLFLIRAARLEDRHGQPRPRWQQAAGDNLGFAADSQDASGNLGSYYHQDTGAVVERGSAAGMLWIAALAEGAGLLGDPDLLAVARRAGDHYAGFVEDAFIYGAPEDVHLAPTSEDAYNALIAYVALYEADGDGRWLRLARQAADWMMTFRWTYNIAFDEHTVLGHYDFRSRGADQASPSNQHLHAYGLVCLAELVRLWRHTGDDHYLQRARDNLSCFLQFVARQDGDFNARKGMVSERYYQTNCFQPKGSLLTLSHAWCVGVTLHGCLVAMDDPEAFPPRQGHTP